MSKKIIEIIKCDVCGSEQGTGPVETCIIFTTETTEGRACDPSLTLERLDLCGNCLGRHLDGNMIFARGAQGYNEYYFKEK